MQLAVGGITVRIWKSTWSLNLTSTPPPPPPIPVHIHTAQLVGSTCSTRRAGRTDQRAYAVPAARCFKTFELGYENIQTGVRNIRTGLRILHLRLKYWHPPSKVSAPDSNIKPAFETCKISHRPTKSMSRNFKPGFKICWLPAWGFDVVIRATLFCLSPCTRSGGSGADLFLSWLTRGLEGLAPGTFWERVAVWKYSSCSTKKQKQQKNKQTKNKTKTRVESASLYIYRFRFIMCSVSATSWVILPLQASWSSAQ